MSAYIQPIKTAMTIFPFLALAISGIFFIYEYRKYGRFLFFRGLVLYSFVFYLLCAYLLVILPLPPVSEVAQYTGSKYELHLGASLQHFLQQTVLVPTDPSTYLPAMKQSVFLEPMFNIVILVPFGIYLRYFFDFSLKKAILASFCLSLFFELTQLSGLYFMYPRPYRLFDVNDLFNNTLGGTIGFAIEPLFTFLLPSSQQLEETAYKKGEEVTLFRRFAALAIDWIFLTLVTIIVAILSRGISGDPHLNFIDTTWWYFFQVFWYFIVLGYFLKGQTLGKKLVRIRVVENKEGRISFKSLLIRYGLLYVIYGGIGQFTAKLAPLSESNNHLLVAVAAIVTISGLVIQGLFFLNILVALIRKKRQLFYERISKTYVISTIKKAE